MARGIALLLLLLPPQSLNLTLHFRTAMRSGAQHRARCCNPPSLPPQPARAVPQLQPWPFPRDTGVAAALEGKARECLAGAGREA